MTRPRQVSIHKIMLETAQNEILKLSARDLLRLYKARELSPVEAAKACLARIDEQNPTLNAFCFVDAKTTLQQAMAAEMRWRDGTPQGSLDGALVTIKDLQTVAGWPTRCGSRLTSDIPAAEDSPPVARLREAGAVFLGKTTTPEFGHKGVTDSPLHGITRNPWDLSKTPGGSSGGAAVAAAIGAGHLHLGSDAGGSLRIPASFTGVFGFKPSPGLVPNWPPSLFSTLSSSGPMTRHVADAALMLDVLTRPDARDWHALPIARPDFSAAVANAPQRRLKIAYAPTVNATFVRPDVAAAVGQAVKKIAQYHDVEEIALDIPDLITVFNRHWGATAMHLAEMFPAEKRPLMDPRLQEWARRGAAMPLFDYVWAERQRMEIGAQVMQIFNTYDLLLTPTTAMTAFDAGQDMPLAENGQKWDDWTPFTYIANLAKLPACSIPCGVTDHHLPVGLQLMGGYLKDATVMSSAAMIEALLPFKASTKL